MFPNPLNSKFHQVIPFWISCLFLFFHFAVVGQNRASILKDQKKLQAEIALTQTHLQSLQKDKSVSLKKWNALNHQIASRNALLNNLEMELDMIEADMVSQEADITLLKQRYDQNRNRYKDILRKFYRTRSTFQPVAFILSSGDIYTAWKRMIFYRSQVRHHAMVLQELSLESEKLLARLSELGLLRKSKSSTVELYESQQSELNVAQKVEKEELARLKKNEKVLFNRLRTQEKQQAELASMLTTLVNNSINKSPSKNRLPEAARKLDNAFGANKGKLPWPVINGYVAKNFGKQRHPELKMIYINNNGIDIITEANTSVQCIFEGTVLAVQSVAGFQKTILVNHGTYYTVYANVDNVQVSKGEKVSRGQLLAYTGSQDGQGVLHFELWKVKTLQNPSSWLQAR